MDDTQTQDVVTAEQTASESSTAEQSVQESPESAQAPEGRAEIADDRPEINRYAEKARKLERELGELRARVDEQTKPQSDIDPETEAVKKYMKDLGFLSAEEAEAKLQSTLREREAETQLQQEISDLNRRYDGKDGRPKFDKDAVIAYAQKHSMFGPLEQTYTVMHQKELIDWHVQQALTKTKGVQSEGSDGSGSAQIGTTNDDLKQRALKGDENARLTFLKRITAKN